MNKRTRLLIALLLPLLLLLIPTSLLPIDGLTTVQHRLIAIFVLAVLFWILEPVPLFATSVLIIVLELVMVSDKSFILFRGTAGDRGFGTVLNYKEVLGTFASPVIMLFLGGFFLAMAATRYRLDINLARVFLKPFGKSPRIVMLGLMIITAVFSMFMSNTATTALMLAILTPVLGTFKPGDRGRIAFVLAIPFAANIGGMGTPIGTPPNAVAMKYLTGGNAIGFGTWMMFAVPYVVVMLLFAWWLLCRLYRPQSDTINLDITSTFATGWKASTVYITFAATILLWLTDAFHGMNSYVVAMIPVAVFSLTGIISAKDLKGISWDVLWLLAGGIALGVGLDRTGLSKNVISSISFDMLTPWIIVVVSTIITLTISNLMSNTAAANLVLPIVAALGTSVGGLASLGGSRMIILAVTFSASLAMVLPISTPPNALAYASGEIETRHMSKPGLILGIVGLLTNLLLMIILNKIGFF